MLQQSDNQPLFFWSMMFNNRADNTEFIQLCFEKLFQLNISYACEFWTMCLSLYLLNIILEIFNNQY